MYVLSHLESEFEALFFGLFVKSWLYLSLTLTPLCHFGVYNDNPLELGVSPHPQ